MRTRITATTLGALLLPVALPPAAGVSAQPVTSATVTDDRGDGQSRAFDIYWVRGAKSADNLLLTMKVRNVTPKNTAVHNDDGTSEGNGQFNIPLRVNGQKRALFIVSRGGWDGDQAVVSYNDDTHREVDCSPGDEDTETGIIDYGTTASFDYDKDLVRYTIPLSCLPDVTTLRVTGSSFDTRRGVRRSDHVFRKSVYFKWSPEFTVR